MRFLIADHEGKTWDGTTLEEGAELCQTNQNFFFSTYSTPAEALFMYPAYESFESATPWEVEADSVALSHISQTHRQIKVLKKLEVEQPSLEQRQTFAVACCLVATNDKEFRSWASRFLRGEAKAEDESSLCDSLVSRIDELDCGCLFACLKSISGPDGARSSAYSGHSAYSSATVINLGIMAKMCMDLPRNEIAEMLAS